MSKKRFYYEISFILLYAFIIFGCLIYAYMTGSKPAIATGMIGILAVVTAVLNLIKNFSEVDPSHFEGLNKEEKPDDR